MAIIRVIVALVTAIISYVIVDKVISSITWSNPLSSTIAQYIVPIGLVGVLGMTVYFIVGR